MKRAAGQKHFKYLAGYHVHGMYLGGYIIEKKKNYILKSLPKYEVEKYTRILAASQCITLYGRWWKCQKHFK